LGEIAPVTVHAFIDESQRGCQYTLCVALVDPGQLAVSRKTLRGLCMPNQRELHFKKEAPRRRRALADRVAALPARIRVYNAECTRRTMEAARQRAVRKLTGQLLADAAGRVVFDTREHRDKHDRVTINDVLGGHPARTEFTYEHVDSVTEPLIWIADIVGWCYGDGGDLKRRVEPVITEIHQL
jgi:hypothetical protein